MKKNNLNCRSYITSLLLAFSMILCSLAYGQQKLNVLFLGNSYTGVNNLPQLVKDVALSAGDTLLYDSNTPGGYQLLDHSQTPVSQNKIALGDWDYVVLQGQSQEPITNYNDFASGFNALYQLIRQDNPCATVMPYMTWGRKNGDANNCASFPIMCTYLGMDTTLRDRYLNMTKFANGQVSPVSVVWRYIRNNHPTIELYTADESHPSTAGSYAAACSFYAAIFKKDPTLISFDFGLPSSQAASIRNAAKTIVFDNWDDWNFIKKPHADFSYSTGNGTNQVIFNVKNLDNVKQDYFWDFGDGNTSTNSYTNHSYANDGTYTVTLTTTNCDLQGTYTSSKDTVIQFCSHTPTVFTSHGWLCFQDTIFTEPADAYQWYQYGAAIPETGQYISDPLQYNASISGFSVMTTVNGCSELSNVFKVSPEPSQYYSDIYTTIISLLDPCKGDTVPFRIFHSSGTMTGDEVIEWYRNDTLLTAHTNIDSLLITEDGTYVCKVVNPASNCPYDTTIHAVEYNCDTTVSTQNHPQNQNGLSMNLYPNPTLGMVTVEVEKEGQTTLQLYTTMGQLVHETQGTKRTKINLSNLPSGIYLIRIKNSNLPAKRILKY